MKLLVFKAGWCGPCKQYAPHVEETVEPLVEKGVEVELVDVDAHPDIAMQYNVRGIPFTVLETNDGKLLTSWSGMKSANELLDAVEKAMEL